MPTSNAVIRALMNDASFVHNGVTYPISHSTPIPICEKYFHFIRERSLKNVLEVGTLYGQSTLFLAEAIRPSDGHVTTVDLRLTERMWINKIPIINIHEVAERLIREAGLSDHVTFLSGDSNAILPQIAAQEPVSYDFILIDGSHEFSVSLLDFINADNLLRVGGTIALDDIGRNTARNEKLNGGPNRLLPMIFSSRRYKIEMLNSNVALCHKLQNL